MVKDDRQLRTTNNRGLLGYRAKKDGRDCIAVMKGKGQVLTNDWECLGVIYPEELQSMVGSGPYINLDKDDYSM